MNKIVLGFIILTLSLVLMIVLRFYQPATNPIDPANIQSKSQLNQEETIQLVRAVSLLENLDVDRALPLLEELLQRHPTNASLLQNKAIALLTKIKSNSDKISDPGISQEQIDALRTELPKLFDNTEETLELARAQEPKNVNLARLDITREERRIGQLPPVMENALKQDLIEQVLLYLNDFPGDAVLTAKLAAIAESLDRLAPEVRAKVIKPMEDALKTNPRNGYLLASLLRLKSNAEDLSAVDLIDQAIEIARPQAWYMNRLNNGKDFGAELKAVAANAQQAPDEFFAVVDRWTNVFVNTSIQKVDARATAEIEPLSLIRLDQAYTQYGLPRALDPKKINSLPALDSFKWNNLETRLPNTPTNIVSAQWFDWNIDLTPELLIATKSNVFLYAVTNPEQLTTTATEPLQFELLFDVAIPSEVQVVKIADLFEVKSELRKEAAPRTNLNPDSESYSDTYHTTLRDIVIGTKAGLSVIGLESDPTTRKPIAALLNAETTHLPDAGSITQIEAFDVEADGDLDLIVVSDSQLHIYENRGARNFLAADTSSAMPPSQSKITAIAYCDYDRDIDIDLLVAFTDRVGCMENIQHGQFIYRELDSTWQTLTAVNELIFAELDGNISWDWIGRTKDAVHIVRTSTVAGVSVSAIETTSFSFDSPKDIAVIDVNSDSRQDLIVYSDNQQTVLWQSEGELFGFDKANAIDSNMLGVSKTYPTAESSSAIFASHNGDSIQLQFANAASNGDYLKLRVKGIADNNGGGRVNEYAIGSTLELFTTDGYQARMVQDDYTTFGLAPNADPYSLRIIFPNGLTQTVVNPKQNALIEEKQELKGSCPFVYGWDGNRWQMITDLLWNAPLGLQVARGQTIPDRRWEYLLLPRELMQPIGDAYELRVTEELWETAYFDQVELLFFDHPTDQQLASNEKVGPPSIAQPGVWIFSEQTAAPKVVDNSGRDWSMQVANIDEQYAIPWQGYICQGLVDEHFVEIEIPSNIDVSKSQLLLTGWLHPTDTSLNIGISQDPSRSAPKPPALQWVDTTGAVHDVHAFMGFPGGKPKSIVVDLQQANISSGNSDQAKALRISTSAEMYWDQIIFIEGEFQPIEKAQRLDLLSANLHYRGFSELLPRQRHEPHWYHYDRVTQSAKWNPMAGLFTRYGECEKIIEDDDDRMVVMGSGDELVLRFKMDLKPLPSGMVRDFILHNVGWDKDADLNTLTGQSSLPLPFQAMRAYPAPADQMNEQAKVDELNRDTLTREQSMKQFWIQN